MDVELTPDQRSRLSRLAVAQGCEEKLLVREAVERYLDHEEWFSHEVDKGIAAAEAGEFVDHQDVLSLIEGRFPA